MIQPLDQETRLTIGGVTYIIDHFLFQGGTSFVYLAYADNTNTWVVIKEFCPKMFASHITRDANLKICLLPQFRFAKYSFERNQIQFSAEKQPGLIKNNPSFSFPVLHSENNYLVELTTEGASLSEWKHTCCNDQTESAIIYIKACLLLTKKLMQTLDALHSCGVLHLDIKPENLYLSGSEADLSYHRIAAGTSNVQIKFLDFGSSISSEDLKNNIQHILETLSFTEKYAAPILIQLSRADFTTQKKWINHIDSSSDYYSVLMVLKDLLLVRWHTNPNSTEIVGLPDSDYKKKRIKQSILSLFDLCHHFPGTNKTVNFEKALSHDKIKEMIMSHIDAAVLAIDNPAGFSVDFVLEQGLRMLDRECGGKNNIEETLLTSVQKADGELELYPTLLHYIKKKTEKKSAVETIIYSSAAGIGKTTSLLHVFAACLYEKIAGTGNIIPFYIPLKYAGNNITEYICRTYFGVKEDAASFENWLDKTSARVLFILDAYEEFSGDDTTLITWWTRSKSFGTAPRDLLISLKTQESPASSRFPLNQSVFARFDMLRMDPLSDIQIQTYFGDLLKNSIYSRLLHIPMLARMAKSVLANPELINPTAYWNEKGTLTVHDLCTARLMKVYLDLQIKRYAYAEHKNQAVIWKNVIFNDIAKAAARSAHWEFSTSLTKTEKADFACKCGILKVSEDNTLHFSHRLWHEFMIAYMLSDSIDAFLSTGVIASELQELSFSESVYWLAGELLGKKKVIDAIQALRHLKASIDFSDLLNNEHLTVGSLLRCLAKLPSEMAMSDIQLLSKSAEGTAATVTMNVLNIAKQQYNRSFNNRIDLEGLDLRATSLQKVTGLDNKLNDSLFHTETFGIQACRTCCEILQVLKWQHYLIAIVCFGKQRTRRAFMVIDQDKKSITTCHLGSLFSFDHIVIDANYDMFARVRGYRDTTGYCTVTKMNINERGEVFIVRSEVSNEKVKLLTDHVNDPDDLAAANEALNKKRADPTKCRFCARYDAAQNRCTCPDRSNESGN